MLFESESECGRMDSETKVARLENCTFIKLVNEKSLQDGVRKFRFTD